MGCDDLKGLQRATKVIGPDGNSVVGYVTPPPIPIYCSLPTSIVYVVK